MEEGFGNGFEEINGPEKNTFSFGVLYTCPKDRLLRVDPSECVRSADIIPIMKRTFPQVDVCSFGGGILQHALDNNFYEIFDKNNPKHVNTIKLLRQLEMHYMQAKELDIENAFLIAYKQVL
jgi:hypothetical protein